MASGATDPNDNDETQGPRHAEWLALLLDREADHRQDKRLGARLRQKRTST